MKDRARSKAIVATCLVFAVALCVGMATIAFAKKGSTATATITVSGKQWGTSTCYIGANEGSSYFNINDLTDLGINTYRIYGGMSRWEWLDDSATFGSPTIAQIEANPDVINWAWWDAAIDATAAIQNGSDYWWSDPVNGAKVSARTIFTELQSAGIKPVVVLRNVDNSGNPAWASQLNPPNTTAGENEWWEHVFATVYEFDVRNNFGVDDWEVHNEPNNKSQGWRGNETDYMNFVELTSNAINYVYSTYLPGRTPHIFAPVTTGGSNWPLAALKDVGPYFDTMDVHNYDSNIDSYDQTVHGYLNSTGYPNEPLWVTEWSTYKTGQYASVSFAISNVMANLINSSAPGNDYVYGSHIFSLYNWGTAAYGLIGAGDVPTASYYAMRLAIRGLQGCRPTYQSTSTDTKILAITTEDTSGNIYVLLDNTSTSSVSVTINLSALLNSGGATEWEFSSSHDDVVVANPVLTSGHVTITVDPISAELLKF